MRRNIVRPVQTRFFPVGRRPIELQFKTLLTQLCWVTSVSPQLDSTLAWVQRPFLQIALIWKHKALSHSSWQTGSEAGLICSGEKQPWVENLFLTSKDSRLPSVSLRRDDRRPPGSHISLCKPSPQSARFQWMSMSKRGLRWNPGEVYCGKRKPRQWPRSSILFDYDVNQNPSLKLFQYRCFHYVTHNWCLHGFIFRCITVHLQRHLFLSGGLIFQGHVSYSGMGTCLTLLYEIISIIWYLYLMLNVCDHWIWGWSVPWYVEKILFS